MTSRRNIATALGFSAGGSSRKSPIETEDAGQPSVQITPSASTPRPSRVGKTNITGYFPPEVKRQLKLIAATEDKTIQQLLGESLNMLFVHYGKAEIAPTEREER